MILIYIYKYIQYKHKNILKNKIYFKYINDNNNIIIKIHILFCFITSLLINYYYNIIYI